MPDRVSRDPWAHGPRGPDDRMRSPSASPRLRRAILGRHQPPAGSAPLASAAASHCGSTILAEPDDAPLSRFSTTARSLFAEWRTPARRGSDGLVMSVFMPTALRPGRSGGLSYELIRRSEHVVVDPFGPDSGTLNRRPSVRPPQPWVVQPELPMAMISRPPPEKTDLARARAGYRRPPATPQYIRRLAAITLEFSSRRTVRLEDRHDGSLPLTTCSLVRTSPPASMTKPCALPAHSVTAPPVHHGLDGRLFTTLVGTGYGRLDGLRITALGG